MHTAKDFIAYVDRFADQNSLIFVDVLGGKIQAVLDFHEVDKTGNDKGSVNSPRHCKHIANYVVNHTPEFIKIKNASGNKFSQTEFAVFLEDVMPYINQTCSS